MTGLRHILFPYDFSVHAQHVAPFVRSLAGHFGAHVTVISVVPPTFAPVIADMQAHARVGEDMARWRLNLQSQLDQALIEEFAGLDVERVADCGDPAIRITQFSHSRNVDLIVMPTRGTGTFRGLLIGSVTSKVLHDASCPVWTTAHTEVQKPPRIPQAILCAIDGSVKTPALVQWVDAFARSTGASLNFLHVVGPVSDWPELESERRLQEHVSDTARGRIGSMLGAAGVDAPLRIAVGDIVASTTDAARQQQADLVVIGRGSIAEPFGRLRTHAFGIIQRSPCPVLSI